MYVILQTLILIGIKYLKAIFCFRNKCMDILKGTQHL